MQALPNLLTGYRLLCCPVVQAGVDVNHMYCKNGGNCLLRALTAENVAAISCPKIRKSLDVLAETVLNCSARAAVYKCAEADLPYAMLSIVLSASLSYHNVS